MPVDYMTALKALNLPPELIKHLGLAMGLNNLYEDQINEAYQPLYTAANQAQTQADAASSELRTAQAAPMPALSPVADALNTSLGNAAERLSPGHGFSERAQAGKKEQLGQLMQQRAERLKMLEATSDQAAARAQQLGDAALQAKHLEKAHRFSTAREEVLRSVGQYFTGQQEHANKMQEQNAKFAHDLQLETTKFRNELKVKYGTENPSPEMRARLASAEKMFTAHSDLITRFVTSTLQNPMNKKSPDEIFKDALAQLQAAGQDYEGRLQEITSGQAPKPQEPQQQISPEEHIIQNLHSWTDITNFRDFNKFINGKDETGKPIIDEQGNVGGIPTQTWTKVARHYYSKVTPLYQQALQYKQYLEGVIDEVGPQRSVIDRRTHVYGQLLNEANKQLAKYGLYVPAPTLDPGNGITVE